MKTKYLLSLIAGSLVLINFQANAQTGMESQPNRKYNVHREYDQNGNLSRYDSTVVSSWGNSNKQGSDSVRSEFHYSESHSIVNMDSVFNDQAGNPFSFNDSTLNRMMNNFGFNFFDNPSDSEMFGQSPDVPFFGPQFGMPGFGDNIAKQMEEMEKQMKSMMQHGMNMYRNQQKPLIKVPKQEAKPVQPKLKKKHEQQVAPSSPPPASPPTPPAQNMNIYNI